jgi:hypothetical protein
MHEAGKFELVSVVRKLELGEREETRPLDRGAM